MKPNEVYINYLTVYVRFSFLTSFFHTQSLSLSLFSVFVKILSDNGTLSTSPHPRALIPILPPLYSRFAISLHSRVAPYEFASFPFCTFPVSHLSPFLKLPLSIWLLPDSPLPISPLSCFATAPLYPFSVSPLSYFARLLFRPHPIFLCQQGDRQNGSSMVRWLWAGNVFPEPEDSRKSERAQIQTYLCH